MREHQLIESEAARKALAQPLPRGLTPASLLADEPLSVRAGAKNWEPHNMEEQFQGPSRFGRLSSNRSMSRRYA
jgi:membrane carboxypeptidase/penicillin-binding protein